MQLPKRVKIAGSDYDVEPFNYHSTYSCIGASQHMQQNIRIAVGGEQHPQQVVKTFLHEVLHCIFAEWMHKLHDSSGPANDGLEEEIVTGFELGLISFMRDNPGVMRAMLKALKV